MKATELLGVLHNYQLIGESIDGLEISTIVNDNREIQANCCFVAIRGETFDGHDAVKDVVRAGAKLIIIEKYRDEWKELAATFVVVSSSYRVQAILANQFFDQPSTKLRVVGITGTNGKTTTSSMLSDLLEILDHSTGLIGTMHYKVADTFYPAINTTPNAMRLQQLYYEMVEVGCQDVAIEASSHALNLGRLWYTDVDCGIFTNISREHLDFHHTMENYAQAKSLLFSQMGQRFIDGKPRVAIINQDDEFAEMMIQAGASEVFTYSLKDSTATAYGSNYGANDRGVCFDLHYNSDKYHVQLPMMGNYNAMNFMAVFLCLVEYYGYDVQDVLTATEKFTGVEGRMQSIEEGQDFQIVVDFAHTVEAIEQVLSELKKVSHKDLIVVFGHSGGNRDSGARPEIGDTLFKLASKIVFTADNPRFENVTKISQEMIQDHDEKPYVIIEDREEATKFAIGNAEKNDMVVFLGKANEPFQVIGAESLPYDEVAIIQTILHK